MKLRSMILACAAIIGMLSPSIAAAPAIPNGHVPVVTGAVFLAYAIIHPSECSVGGGKAECTTGKMAGNFVHYTPGALLSRTTSSGPWPAGYDSPCRGYTKALYAGGKFFDCVINISADMNKGTGADVLDQIEHKTPNCTTSKAAETLDRGGFTGSHSSNTVSGAC